MGDGPIGSANPSCQAIAPPMSEEDGFRVLIPSVTEPEQPVDLFAKWEVTGFDDAPEHRRDFRN